MKLQWNAFVNISRSLPNINENSLAKIFDFISSFGSNLNFSIIDLERKGTIGYIESFPLYLQLLKEGLIKNIDTKCNHCHTDLGIEIHENITNNIQIFKCKECYQNYSVRTDLLFELSIKDKDEEIQNLIGRYQYEMNAKRILDKFRESKILHYLIIDVSGSEKAQIKDENEYSKKLQNLSKYIWPNALGICINPKLVLMSQGDQVIIVFSEAEDAVRVLKKFYESIKESVDLSFSASIDEIYYQGEKDADMHFMKNILGFYDLNMIAVTSIHRLTSGSYQYFKKEYIVPTDLKYTVLLHLDQAYAEKYKNEISSISNYKSDQRISGPIDIKNGKIDVDREVFIFP